jgi:O-antigen ligase
MQGRRGSWVGNAVIVTLVASALAVATRPERGLERFRSPKLVVLALGAAAVAALMAPALRRAHLRLTDGPLFVYFGVGLASAAAAGLNPGQTGEWLALGLGGLLIFAGARFAAENDDGLPSRIQGAVVIVAALLALLVVAEALGARWPWQTELARPQATIGNRNQLAGFLAVGLILAIARSFGEAAWPWSGALIPITTALALTRCRSAWLAAVVAVLLGGALFAARELAAPRRIAAGGRAAAIVLSCLTGGIVLASSVPWPALHWHQAAPLQSSFERIVDVREGTGKERLEDYRVALALAADSPWLGAGPGRWAAAAAGKMHLVGKHVPPLIGNATPKSDFARVAAETGIGGLLSVMAFIGALVVPAWRRWWRSNARSSESSAFCALFGALIHALADVPLYHPATLVLLSALAGSLDQGPGVAIRMRGWRWAALPVASFVILFVGMRTLAIVQVNRAPDIVDAGQASYRWLAPPGVDEQIALQLLARHRCDEATPVRERVAKSYPHHWGLQYLAGWCEESRGNRATAKAHYDRARELEPHADGLAAAGPRKN